MGPLHLIIHKSYLEERINTPLPDEEKAAISRVLDRINGIEHRESHVKQIISDAEDPDIPNGIHFVVEQCQGYDSVILYGCYRNLCLRFAEHRLESIGVKVTYDSLGVI